MMQDKPHVKCLIVDDDEDYAYLIRSSLEEIPHLTCSVHWEPDFDTALSCLRDNTYAVCLVDYLLGERNGLEFIKAASQAGIVVPMVLLTGVADVEVDLAASRAGAADFIPKGDLSWVTLSRTIRFAVATTEKKSALREANRRLQKEVAKRTRAEKALCEANASLEQRVQEKTHALAESEHRLRESEKLNALGQLAGGVAHDFNNILMIISGYTGRALKHPQMPEAGREALDHVVKAADRAAILTMQMLAFSRHQPLQNRVLAVSGVLDELDTLLRPLIGETIELEISAAEGEARIEADPVHLSQALMNLAINARDAMPKGGKIAIGTDVVQAGEEFLSRNPDLAPGSYVRISVSDEGTGMDAATTARIFEPFFTTKDQGKGTGLGLAMVYGLVQQLKGVIEVDSEPGEGTTFTIYLPFVDRPADLISATVREALSGKGETILLAEDDDSLRVLVGMMLEDLGYKVLEASDGFEALEIEGDYEQPIDLLLSDVVMPNLSGIELFGAVKETRPDIRIILMSGYPCRARADGVDLPDGVPLLQKPVAAESLAHSVRSALEGQPVHMKG